MQPVNEPTHFDTSCRQQAGRRLQMREKWVKHAYRPATYTYHVPGGFRPTDVPAQNALRFESDPSTIIRTAASIAATSYHLLCVHILHQQKHKRHQPPALRVTATCIHNVRWLGFSRRTVPVAFSKLAWRFGVQHLVVYLCTAIPYKH